MTLELFTAELEVPKSGFKWCDAGMVDIDVDVEVHRHDGTTLYHPLVELSKSRYLVPKGRGEIPVRKFDPFEEHTGMFRQFANLPASEDAILNFANRYGWLGVPDLVVQESELPDDDLSARELLEVAGNWHFGDHSEFSGESIEIWSNMIAQISESVSLWDRLMDERKFPQSRTDDEINQDWRRLEVIVNYGMGNTGGAHLSYDGKRIGFRFRYHAVNLTKVLWLQLARAIVGKKQYERCKQCASYFEIGPGVGRKGKVYCSKACKQAASRERKAAPE